MVEPAHGITVATLVNAVQLTLEQTMDSRLTTVFRTYVQMVETVLR